MKTEYDLIVDNPYEKHDDYKQALELILKLRPIDLNTYTLFFFPKTELTERALREGVIKENEVENYSGRLLSGIFMRLDRAPMRMNYFWNLLIGMTRHDWIRTKLIVRIARNEFFYYFPYPVSWIVRAVLSVRRRKLLRERRLAYLFSIKPIARNKFIIKNRLKKKYRLRISFDIYPTYKPVHPERHVAYWSAVYTFLPGENEITVESVSYTHLTLPTKA